MMRYILVIAGFCGFACTAPVDSSEAALGELDPAGPPPATVWCFVPRAELEEQALIAPLDAELLGRCDRDWCVIERPASIVVLSAEPDSPDPCR